jgi:predicted metal-dependent HD superfamily phosphohydrolase
VDDLCHISYDLFDKKNKRARRIILIFFLKSLVLKEKPNTLNFVEHSTNKLIEYITNTLQYFYTVPQRYYHTWKHVERCLKELETVHSFEPLSNQKNAIKAAIYFHDCHDKNEIMSAQTAQIYLSALRLSTAFIEDVFELIMLTRHDQYPMTYAGQIMVDIDLSILGKDRETFDQYENDIRKEYSQFSNSEYNKGRIKFLKNFLYRTPIYYSKHFQDLYENQALINISYLIQKLEDNL